MSLSKIYKTAIILFFVLINFLNTSVYATDNNVIDKIIKEGQLRVGFSSFVPWAFRNKKGKYVGFEIDVAKKLAKDMGVKLDLVPTAWDGIIPALLVGKFDVIIGGMSVTSSRNLKVNFTTIPYNPISGYNVVANRNSFNGKITIKKLNNRNITAGVRRGSSAIGAIRSLFPKVKIKRYDDEAIVTQEVINGGIDFFVAANPLPRVVVQEYPDILVTPFDKPIAQDNIGFAVRKGDPDALNYFDNWIRNNRINGFLLERARYWFDSDAWKTETGKDEE